MKSRTVAILLAALLLVSCSSNAPAATPGAGLVPSPSRAENSDPTPTQVPPTGAAAVPTAPETSSPNCANEDVNKIGQAIASSYAFTTAEEVMTWFCEGAEFEDILVALQTEEIHGTPAEEMLQMRAEGLSWDEIWQVIGLTDTE